MADYSQKEQSYPEVVHVTTDGASQHEGQTAEFEDNTKLQRGLKARQITMIAIGGAIGTGLLVGTGSALARAGPGSIFISYTIVGFIVYLVMCALGEMAAYIPMASGFTGYATRFCDESLGFALGWTYYFKYIIITPNQLTAAAFVIQYWVPREKINPGVFITVFLVAIVTINWLGIRFFGEFEFWLSSIKVVVIIGVIILSFVLALGGGPTHDRTGFRYWKNPGAFAEYIEDGATGRFLGFWSTMVTATFAYLGTELVGVTVGEAQNPRKTIPRAIRLTFYRILIFYCVSVLLLGMIVPYDSEDLAFAVKASTTSASASPFVVAIKLAGINALPGILNGCICLFVFSAANSDLYIASRTLYSLATEGYAPRIFRRTNKAGVPYMALGVSIAFSFLAYLNVAESSKQVFLYFVNLVTIFGLEAWISLLVTHIYFVRARKAQMHENPDLLDVNMPFVSPFGIWGSYGALFMCVLIALTKNFPAFTKGSYGNFDVKTFITGYLGIPLYLALIFGYKLVKKSKGIKPLEADFKTGKDIIDREEEEFLAQQGARKMSLARKKGGWFYRTFVAWLF
ncbi:hypothetical protein DV738_g4184, partial [Chaetothyriales sp. CBS 135597]